MTEAELKAGVVDQLRRVRLEEKRLRSEALGYDAGELDVADLVMASIRYAAEVRLYREMERALLHLGIAVPKAVRDGVSLDWDNETTVCASAKTTLQ